VEWTRADAHGNRELQGISEELLRGFSKRTGQIDSELDRLTEDGRERTPRLVKWAVHATRKPREDEAPDTLYDRWRQEAAERGHDAGTLVRTVTSRTPDRDQDRTVSAGLAGRLFDRLAGSGLYCLARIQDDRGDWQPQRRGLGGAAPFTRPPCPAWRSR
jgi:TrwC relaxase